MNMSKTSDVCVKIVLGAITIALSGCASAMDYEALKAKLKAGSVLKVESAEKVLIMDDTRIAGDALVKFLGDVISSPGMAEYARGGSKEHDEIFACIRQLDRLVGDVPTLHIKLTNFYAKNLASPNAKIQEDAFNALLRKRVVRNCFEWDDESKQTLLAFVEKNPTAGNSNKTSILMGNGLTLLGMSEGGVKTVALLESLDGHVPDYELSRKVALARLGIKKHEDELIDSYMKTVNLKEKGKLALALGQISSENTLSILAKDLRDDAVLEYGGGFNQFVLGGLHLAKEFPGGGRRVTRMGNYEQADFDRAEAWCVERFKTVWDKEKPPVRQIQPVSID
jgi:hypothetical protein